MITARHADIVAPQGHFYIVERIADLCCQLLAGHTMNDVLILNLRKLRASTERLPQPDRGNVDQRFALHDVFDSAGAISLHDAFRNDVVE